MSDVQLPDIKDSRGRYWEVTWDDYTGMVWVKRSGCNSDRVGKADSPSHAMQMAQAFIAVQR